MLFYPDPLSKSGFFLFKQLFKFFKACSSIPNVKIPKIAHLRGPVHMPHSVQVKTALRKVR
jgi:hypothetical protein